jgi:hypothetical protein
MKPTISRLALDLDDLELSGVDVQVLASTEALGLPELGASNGSPNCCTHVTK